MLALFLLTQKDPVSAQTNDQIVSIGKDGRLIYAADDQGNQIPDFSNCGYMGGGVELPDVNVVEILFPEEIGDDTHRIQAAINHVAVLPEDEDEEFESVTEPCKQTGDRLGLITTRLERRI